ncbi:MAG: DUF362 domain-containing protein [Phycisphaerae bacterium]|nr:DUF362 domain-containing protein [Phycisphaerae bacterium]
MAAKVALAKCEDYQQKNLHASITKLLELLGGWEEFVQRGERVLIKPNFIAPRTPEVPAQTDGRLVAEIARQLKQIGAEVLIGDSTAWGSVRNNAALSGLDQPTLDALGVRLVKFNRPCRVTIQTPAGPKKVSIDRTVLEADKIISVPKLKTHQQLFLTGALKNPFGAIVGKRKAWWHFRYGRPETFTDMIVGVYRKVRPVLNILDAVVAMEGQGPVRGSPRKLGLLLASADAAAVDRVACELVAAPSAQVPMLAAAQRAAVGATKMAEIELLGQDLQEFRINDFLFPELTPLRFSLLRVCRSIGRQVRILMSERRENRSTE